MNHQQLRDLTCKPSNTQNRITIQELEITYMANKLYKKHKCRQCDAFNINVGMDWTISVIILKLGDEMNGNAF